MDICSVGLWEGDLASPAVLGGCSAGSLLVPRPHAAGSSQIGEQGKGWEGVLVFTVFVTLYLR